MIRYVSIALVIWGLIAQPLMAAMPAQMMNESTHSLMSTDVGVKGHEHHNDAQIVDALIVEKTAKAPCNEKGADGPSKHCNDCDDNCAKGLCASSCVIGSGVAAFQKTSSTLDLKESIPPTANVGTRPDGLPSLIFHPPKHS